MYPIITYWTEYDITLYKVPVEIYYNILNKIILTLYNISTWYH